MQVFDWLTTSQYMRPWIQNWNALFCSPFMAILEIWAIYHAPLIGLHDNPVSYYDKYSTMTDNAYFISDKLIVGKKQNDKSA